MLEIVILHIDRMVFKNVGLSHINCIMFGDCKKYAIIELATTSGAGGREASDY